MESKWSAEIIIFAHAIKAELLWDMQNYDMIESFESNIE